MNNGRTARLNVDRCNGPVKVVLLVVPHQALGPPGSNDSQRTRYAPTVPARIDCQFAGYALTVVAMIRCQTTVSS